MQVDHFYELFQCEPFELREYQHDLCKKANNLLKFEETANCKNLRHYERMYYDLNRFFEDSAEDDPKRYPNLSKKLDEFIELERKHENVSDLIEFVVDEKRKRYFKPLDKLFDIKEIKVTDRTKYYKYDSEYATTLEIGIPVQSHRLTGKFGVANIRLKNKDVKKNKYPYLVLYQMK